VLDCALAASLAKLAVLRAAAKVLALSPLSASPASLAFI